MKLMKLKLKGLPSMNPYKAPEGVLVMCFKIYIIIHFQKIKR